MPWRAGRLDRGEGGHRMKTPNAFLRISIGRTRRRATPNEGARGPAAAAWMLAATLCLSLLPTANARASTPSASRRGPGPSALPPLARGMKGHGPYDLTAGMVAGLPGSGTEPLVEDDDGLETCPRCHRAGRSGKPGEPDQRLQTPPARVWLADPALGVIDPQIAAGSDSLVVTLGSSVIFYRKDG